jgi:hypothetical protein
MDIVKGKNNKGERKMAARGTRWGVVVVERGLSGWQGEHHLDADYIAKVITNSQGGKMTRDGRDYTFGRTVGENDFYETDTEPEAVALAERFNRLSGKRLWQKLKKLA